MFDMAEGKRIYDAESEREISTQEASDKILEFCRVELGLNEKSTARDITRALKKPAAREFFEIIEEAIDRKISTGWHDDNEFFNEYVEMANMADGDANEFYAENDVILTVCKISGDHHDLDFRIRVA